jgi:predicted nucleic acid-binding protein
VVTLDTSATLGLADREDPDHDRLVTAFDRERPPYIVPEAALAETAYMVQSRLGTETLTTFLADLESGRFRLECGRGDLERTAALLLGYHDLPLDFADAAVCACAERCGGRVLTLDEHLHAVAGEGRIEIVPLSD